MICVFLFSARLSEINRSSFIHGSVCEADIGETVEIYGEIRHS